MPANKPERPAPGASLVLPRVTDKDTQRALDQIAVMIRQMQSQLELYDDQRNGRVPASGGGAVNFLRADRVWAVPAGGGGGGLPPDADYGDVIVSGGGVVWTVDALPESRIAGLVADLAAKVPTSEVITTTAPLTIDGGSSANLSAPRTLAVGQFGTAATGIVTASAGATNILLGDNTWITIAVLASLLGLGRFVLGNGSDGTATMDGSTTVAGMVPVANVYTAVRSYFFADLVINGGITFRPAGFPQHVRGTLTGNGVIESNGGSAVGTTPGAVPYSTSLLPVGVPGVAPGTTGAGATSAPQVFDATAAAGGAAGTPPTAGGNGGRGHGGGGGGGGIGGAGGAGGAVTVKLAAAGDFRVYQSAVSGRDILDQLFSAGSGGGGGANGFGATNGGASGASGGWMVIAAGVFAGSGTYEAKGGNGAGGATSAPGNGGGGGGGGGAGGVVVLVSPTGTAPTPIVTGGSGGAGGGSSGGGWAGAPGGSGGAGVSVIL